MTPDAEEELDEVLEDHIYVIGGIVDGSVKKGLSLGQACEMGAVCTRKLPFKTHGPPGANPVLNVDTVVKLLAERLKRNDWPGIFADCLTGRRCGAPTPRML